MRLVELIVWIVIAASALPSALSASATSVLDLIDPNDPNNPTPSVSPDPFEPDNSPDTARPISCNTSQDRTISSATDVDWLSFEIPVASQVLINAESDRFPPWVALQTSFPTQQLGFANGQINRVCGLNALPPGEYRIAVDSDTELSYAMSVTCSPCDRPNPTTTATRTPTPTATPVRPDPYEPDGVRNLAKPIACGTTQFHTLDAPLDVDWVSFGLTERSQVVFVAKTNDGESLDTTLFGSDARVDPAIKGPSHLCGENALEPGAYAAAVSNFLGYHGEYPQQASYRLTLACVACPLLNHTATPTRTLEPTATVAATPTPPPSDPYEPDDHVALASAIACGETQTHTFNADDHQDWFRLRLPVSSQVVIRTTPIGDRENRPCVWFAGPDRAWPDCYDDRPAARVCGLNALAAGDHVFEIEPWWRPWFTYDVSVSCTPCDLPNPPPTPTKTYSWPSPPPSPTPPSPDRYEPDNDAAFAKPIACGTSQSHTIAAGYDPDWLTIRLDSRTQVVLRVTGDADVHADVLTPDGSYVAEYTREAQRVCGIDALEAGQYLVKVDGWAGAYDVTLDCMPCDLPNPEATATETPEPTDTPLPRDAYEPDDSLTAAARIRCNETQARTISPGSDIDWATFLVPELSQVVVTTSLFTRIELRDSSEARLDAEYEQITHACGANALAPGAYSISIDARRSDDSGTSYYYLTLACSPCDHPNPTPSPTPTSTYPTPAPPDAYEPDDADWQARSIDCGTIQSRSLSPAGDIDWVAFTLPAEAQVVLQAVSAPDPQPDIVIDLFHEAHGLWGSETNLLYRLCGRDPLPAGDYFLELRNYGALANPHYDLSLTCLTCPHATPTPSPTATLDPTDTPAPTATPSYGPVVASGDLLCSAGPRNGLPCEAFEHCPAGACVIAQGLCSDGFICGCPSGTCATAIACAEDTSYGTCAGGVSPGSCCDMALNCLPGDACVGTSSVCVGGPDQGFSCRADGHCRNGRCLSTGCFCDGGDYDGYACVTSTDCPSGGNCDCVPGATPTVPFCLGDCSKDLSVTVDELLMGVRIALGADVGMCPSFDASQDGEVTVDEILTAVVRALKGC